MELRFTNDWLRRQIKKDADLDCDAGIPLLGADTLKQFIEKSGSAEVAEEPDEPKPLQHLIRQVRRRDQLTISQFALRVEVSSEDIENIEANADFVPSPRTIHKIAVYLRIPTPAVQRLVADAKLQNDYVSEAALKFAASSGDLSRLSQIERRKLNDFVKVLAAYKGK